MDQRQHLIFGELFARSNPGGGRCNLLNVGPEPTGKLPGPAIDKLKEIGHGAEANSDAIHGTRESPFAEKLPWGYATCRDDKVYLFVKRWPERGRWSLRVAERKQEEPFSVVVLEVERAPEETRSADKEGRIVRWGRS